MLMTKGLDLKILYTLLIAVSGIVLTIGAASALMVYAENLEVNNPAGDSSIKVTSSTGHSKLILEDQGKRTWSVKALDEKNKLLIIDETKNKVRLTIKKGGQVGIGTINPKAILHVAGTFKTNSDANIGGDLNVDGILTGAYIATLEATILDLQTRLAALEASMAVNEPMIVTNEAMIATHDTMIAANDASIASNSASIADNSASIEDLEEGVPPQGNPCDANGDGAITANEMFDYIESVGNPGFTLGGIQQAITIVEGNVNSPMSNGILDTPAEITEWNGVYLVPNGIPTCPA